MQKVSRVNTFKIKTHICMIKNNLKKILAEHQRIFKDTDESENVLNKLLKIGKKNLFFNAR